ncbi:MAG: alpha/beta hydrolase [Nocardioides sp.]|nr:alpha/beta hydrolase [Nocardioides sp.]
MTSTAPRLAENRVVRRAAAASDAVKGAVFRRLMGLPPQVQRRLLGRPVVRDGLTLSPEIQLMLALQKLAGEEGLEVTENAGDARARRDLTRQSQLVSGVPPIGQVRDLSVDGAAGSLPARLYVPRILVRASEVPGSLAPVPGTRDPLLVYFHGGGMVRGDLDSHDAVCRVIAERAGCRVLSVDYRLAPEHPFPAGVDDAMASYRWVLRHADLIGADTNRLAVGGDSAGAYLAAVTAIEAAREGFPLAFQMLAYPVADWTSTSRSRKLFGEGFLLTKAFMDSAEQAYLGCARRDDPRISVVYADLPENLAPAFVGTAGFDPLRDEGEAYAAQLKAAGVPVTLQRFDGLIHGFVHLLHGRDSRAAVHALADALAAGLR